jgi:uncharacterized protein YdcH (DUF465 family)
MPIDALRWRREAKNQGVLMFPEYRDLIARLQAEGTHKRFLSLYQKHKDLDLQISALKRQDSGTAHVQLDILKREKLRVKDELYELLRQEAAAS